MDEKGRVTIPKSIPDRLNLRRGERVEVSVEDGRIVVKPRISRESFVDAMRGCITETTRRPDAAELSPADLKADWTGDLPTGR
ncbi:AbrB/MazE/SpoVT family DNA-binding domain-containing protein [Halegenticoccus tardaugens]|uniref:AbrB/MazE/SpoVT family DNA-binding domain-containing protein n=1 Tax=Halegenticoccus tardaugens TaxID=2071624 RepID=UPI00100BDD06|nr:AbrB/MazE/SpoVT family DNA-binding domain-containing protein [Halegenticoccus tardaugens]